MHLQSAVVMDEPQFAEFIHEKIHAAARRPHHPRQRFLRNHRHRWLRRSLPAVLRQQQQRSRLYAIRDRFGIGEGIKITG